jgi:hypothetical protein
MPYNTTILLGGNVTPPGHSVGLPTSPSKMSFSYAALVGDEISNNLVQSCADLFSTNDSVWGYLAITTSMFTKPGK